MAEAARRMGNGLGADVARRLMARPIRLQQSSSLVTTQPETGFAQDRAAPVSDLTLRLETEIKLMKAVLKAERAENARLRAGAFGGETPLGDEAQAVQDRWVALVDRLLTAR